MTVYIDDAFLQFRNMRMCHMIADTSEELLDMARKIGVKVKWIQYAGQPKREHFDICSSKRDLAIKAGAVEMSFVGLAVMLRNRSPIDGRLVPLAKGQPLLKR